MARRIINSHNVIGASCADHDQTNPIRQRRTGPYAYLWDTRHVETVGNDLFDPQCWQLTKQLVGQASGRGAAYFLRPDENTGWVLRHSRRGGLIAKISDDNYIWLSQSRCRVFREFRLLAKLQASGLPVPEPVAARVIRRGVSYKGDLITVQVADAKPLADWLTEQSLTRQRWQEIGAIIARFHNAGVYHHDLNARNILIDADGQITLIDFDKSRVRKPGRWREKNIARLRRSLDKIARQQSNLNFQEEDWKALLNGYHESRSRLGASMLL